MPPRKKAVPTAARKSRKSKAAPVPEQHNYRVRVRMYRHGLGDCFLLTFPRPDEPPFNLLIDCGALSRNKSFMTGVVQHLEQAVKSGAEKGRLDLVVATHEHKDHVSGFNQARAIFDRMDIGGVWLAWTENLSLEEAKALKQAKKRALAKLQAAVASPFAGAGSLEGVHGLLEFSAPDDSPGLGQVVGPLDYLKLRGKAAGNLQFLSPGGKPLTLQGVEDVRVYVLGPPHDPILLKTSAVTQKMKADDVVYHLGLTGREAMEALQAAVSSADGVADEPYQPFAAEHRISRRSEWFRQIRPYIRATYDAPEQKWRRIEEDWLGAFGQLALDLDNDTNNTSLVLAFEFVKSGEVLLFVGDAQVGNWESWAKVSFELPGSNQPLPALDLLKRTVFYKVGHHGSHNATLKRGGLELMESPALVAFIPLDKATAKRRKWDMPAEALSRRLNEKAARRVVISDVETPVPFETTSAGVAFDSGLTYVDYTLPVSPA